MLSFLYVYSDHSILECYNLFSGVELSMRSFFVICFCSIAPEQLFDTPPENRRQRNQVENSYDLEKTKFQFVLIPIRVLEVADLDGIWGGNE